MAFVRGQDTTPPPGNYATSNMAALAASVAADNGIAIGGMGPTAGSQEENILLYMGLGLAPTHTHRREIGSDFATPAAPPRKVRSKYATPEVMSVNDAQNAFAGQSDGEIRRMATMLVIAGFAGRVALEDVPAVVKEATLDDILGWHANFLQGAADAYAMGGGQKITPEKFLRRRLEFRLGKKWDGSTEDLNKILDDASADDEQQLKNGKFTTTYSTTDIMNPSDAKFLVRTLLQQQLGRDPTKDEYEDFLAAARTIQKQNPGTSTVTDTYKEGELTHRSTVNRPGISPSGISQELYEDVKNTPEWATWQAVGTYAPALFAALDSPVEGV